MRLMEYGLLDHWENTYSSSIDKCNLNAVGSKGIPLNKSNNVRLITRFNAFFIVLGIGLSLSFFVLLMLGLGSSLKKKNHQRKKHSSRLIIKYLIIFIHGVHNSQSLSLILYGRYFMVGFLSYYPM